jgi:sugar O-acyltransferase (sialic acid O-acetyltransferase NeuD family)
LESEKLQKVVILGAGGFGREVLDIFVAENRVSKKWEVLGFVDDNVELHDKVLNGYPVLGPFDWFTTIDPKEIKVIAAVGDNKVRRKVVEKAKELGLEFCSVIHPTVILTPFVRFGEGVIVTAGVIFTNQISVGNHVIINLDVTIGHDTVIEDFVNLNPGVHINGNNRIEEGAYIGSGAVTIQDISIGKWSIVGAGAVVVKNIPDNVLAVGVPAKVKKVFK